MKFPWHKYEELPLDRRNTLQVFITNRCNLKCKGCFARHIMGENQQDISLEEYFDVVKIFKEKGGKQINILGGEPLLHPELEKIILLNNSCAFKTTIYTNGYYINKYNEEDFHGAKLRISLYCKTGKTKSFETLPKIKIPFDVCFMVSAKTTVSELLKTAYALESNPFVGCKTFFISSIRELDNERKEFFDDTEICMPVVKYKELVHEFLNRYEGDLGIDISKRGVFESTKTLPDNKCRFANYFIGGKIIQCPYDVVNLNFQEDYSFGKRYCQHNNSCLMSKIKFKKINEKD